MDQRKTFDVLVVGLGPAGACAARSAAQAGRGVLAIDRKQAAGIPVQCAEFVPPMLSPTIDAVSAARCQTIQGMLTFVENEPPDHKNNFPGVMVDRAQFDQHLVAKAIDAGVECRFNTVVTTVDTEGSVYLGSGEVIDAPVVIGADGPRSRIGRAINSVNHGLVVTRQITVPLCDPYSATDVFLSANYCGGYAWLFPRGAVANLGLGVQPGKLKDLKPLLDSLHRELVKQGRVGEGILSRTGGAIPVGGMRVPHGTIKERLILLCGDAAGLSNPITGAGISSAVVSGTLAGESAAAWLELKGHTPKSPSMVFDEVFTEQIIATGKIEEGRTLRRFLQRTEQPLLQDWIIEMGKRVLAHLPIKMLVKMGIAGAVAPRTRRWARAGAAIQEYQDQQQAEHRKALKLDELISMAEQELTSGSPQ
ncbi:MAG: geranylgeranyl reductase family protein [Proteobacteria bacterium]|nr:geranylgeranyl reductase family protein [Pseudomonadota bacterium]